MAASIGGTRPQLEQLEDFRVLKRLKLPAGSRATGTGSAQSAGLIVDVETTGLNPKCDKIIELAMRPFRFDEYGTIIEVGELHAWLEDPGEPLPEEIRQLTGLTDEELAGQAIDTSTAMSLLLGAEVVIAHNASFDRKFVERRLPDARGLAWACTCREVDWLARGLDGRGLGWLLAQAGWFYTAHRAGADVDAVIALLEHRSSEDKTALSELLECASQPTWMFRAVGAHFDVKDRLKARGYRWDAVRMHWYREVAEDGKFEEEAWLSKHVYADGCRPRASEPLIDQITWFNRHA